MMKRTANVKIRKLGTFEKVSITAQDKPEIIRVVTEKWQKIISLISQVIGVPSGLIMRITKENMEVFLKSENNDNPYPDGGSDVLGHGLYCETVIGTGRELLVPNALNDPIWVDNPDVKLGMISYYGLPIQWPDKEFFGTICVLDNKTNPYNETFKELMHEFKLSMEKDLELLVNQEMLKNLSERDSLTSIFNRRKTAETLTLEHDRSMRYKTPLAIALIDLDKFKQVNDKYGHDVGDKVLKAFSDAVSARIRNVDIFGRWGGDEFLLICPNTDSAGATRLLRDIYDLVVKEIKKTAVEVGFSYGIAEAKLIDTGSNELLKRADEALYKAKKHR